jgi:hypothetical protein
MRWILKVMREHRLANGKKKGFLDREDEQLEAIH